MPYSCLLFNTCSAYAEVGLLVLIYSMCSLCLIVIDLPDCPIYALLQVLHLSWNIPLGFVLISLSISCWYIMFVVQKAMFKLLCLKGLVTFHINGL
jgi:hypothetical protein